MDRCGGCAPPKGPEAGTFIEARYPGILASFRHGKKRLLHRQARHIDEERNTSATRTNDPWFYYLYH
jgi:hypothetical protein